MVEVLSEGFQDLQWFWKELHRKLPSDELLKLSLDEKYLRLNFTTNKYSQIVCVIIFLKLKHIETFFWNLFN